MTPPPFLLQICSKVVYIIYEYACLMPEKSAIAEKLAKKTTTMGTTQLSFLPRTFLNLKICQKLCYYFIHEYVWFTLDIPSIF